MPSPKLLKFVNGFAWKDLQFHLESTNDFPLQSTSILCLCEIFLACFKLCVLSGTSTVIRRLCLLSTAILILMPSSEHPPVLHVTCPAYSILHFLKIQLHLKLRNVKAWFRIFDTKVLTSWNLATLIISLYTRICFRTEVRFVETTVHERRYASHKNHQSIDLVKLLNFTPAASTSEELDA